MNDIIITKKALTSLERFEDSLDRFCRDVANFKVDLRSKKNQRFAKLTIIEVIDLRKFVMDTLHIIHYKSIPNSLISKRNFLIMYKMYYDLMTYSMAGDLIPMPFIKWIERQR